MKVLRKTDLKVPGNLKFLDRVLTHFDLINQSSIPRKVWLECQLALAEGFTNAVRHAHKQLPTERSIEIEIVVFETLVELSIIDYGPPFDLDACIQSYSQGNQNDSGGGRGVILLHKIADRLSYFRTEDDRNCLRIVKNYCPVVDDRRLL